MGQSPLLARFEGALAAELGGLPPTLGDAARHTLLQPGKRLRPLICLQACTAVGGTVEAALPLALAVELVHGMSLILDDLPCMDDALERRGAPACHLAFGEAKAILASDALLALAFRVVARGVRPPVLVPELVEMLADAAGFDGMAHAQALELETTDASVGQIAEIARGKTGVLFSVAAVGGGRIGGAAPAQLDALRRYAEHLGDAFQAIDDLLDVTGDETGKCSGRDSHHQRPSIVRVAGPDRARAVAEKGLEAAARELTVLPGRAGLVEVLDSLDARLRALSR